MLPRTDRLVSVPTVFKFEFTTVLGSAVSVSVLADAGTVTSTVPSKGTPFIFLGVLNLVAVNALPVNCCPTKVLASITLNLLVPDAAVTLPVTSPTKSAVIVPAEKSPPLSLATTVPILLFGVASTDHVVAVLPSKSLPLM